MRKDGRGCRRGEEDCAVSVRFEVDTDGEGGGSVMKVLDTSGNAGDGNFL